MKQNFFVCSLIASEMVVLNCPYKKKRILVNEQSMSRQTDLRFYISLRETFSNSISFTLITKYDRGASTKILIVFWTAYHVARRRFF